MREELLGTEDRMIWTERSAHDDRSKWEDNIVLKQGRVFIDTLLRYMHICTQESLQSSIYMKEYVHETSIYSS